MKKIIIPYIEGDGIGPEIVTEAMKVLDAVGKKYGHTFNTKELLFGGASIDEYGEPLTDETLEICKESDAVLLGAVGGPKWDNVDKEKRPERGLLKIRKELGLFANLRPTTLFKELKNSCSVSVQLEQLHHLQSYSKSRCCSYALL
jgi:3-isopropylmalate dehydrogenase